MSQNKIDWLSPADAHVTSLNETALPRPMMRASYSNQARVHNGYHYPRSFPTAQRARENYPRFCEEYGFAIVPGMRKYYAIAKGSRVTADQFQRFCDGIFARALLHMDRYFDNIFEHCEMRP